MELKNKLNDDVLQKRSKERKEDARGSYYRDTTAIIHSSAFRRLKHKTQVFFSPKNDHICTRIEHVLHVASIASTICRAFSLDQDLAWAIGVGHDLGHTPFGHVGEKILDSLYKKKNIPYSFEHEVNSLRVVDFLSNHGEGLNLTYAVRDGIVSHNGEQMCARISPSEEVKDLSSIKERRNLIPSTYEGVVVRFSDSIAYLGRDAEDACRLGIIKSDDLPEIVKERLGRTNSEIINTLVNDIISSSSEKEIGFSDEIFKAVEEFISFNTKYIYQSEVLKGCSDYFNRLLNLILSYLDDIYSKYKMDENGYKKEKNMLAFGFCNHLLEMHDKYIQRGESDDNLILDYIAGMTDNFCLDAATEILIPEHINEEIDKSQFSGKWFDKN